MKGTTRAKISTLESKAIAVRFFEGHPPAKEIREYMTRIAKKEMPGQTDFVIEINRFETAKKEMPGNPDFVDLNKVD